MSALPPNADIRRRNRHVRFMPKPDVQHQAMGLRPTLAVERPDRSPSDRGRRGRWHAQLRLPSSIDHAIFPKVDRPIQPIDHLESIRLGGERMRAHSFLQTLVCAALTSIVLAAGGSMAKAQDLPSYMAPISGRTASSPAETAMKNVLALNTAMFELFDNSPSSTTFSPSIPSFSACSPGPAAGSFFTGRAWRRSRRH